MGVEVEARFRAETRATLERLATRPTLAAATLGPARTVLEEDRYLDTADARLGAARWACRLRTREGVTRISLKGPPDAPITSWLHRRPEVEGPASPTVNPDAWPESEARELLTRLSGGAPLVEWLRLLQERTELAVTLEARTLGMLTLDVVTVERDGRSIGELLVVEMEIRADGDAERDLGPLAEALAAEPGLRPEPRTKLELSLEFAG